MKPQYADTWRGAVAVELANAAHWRQRTKTYEQGSYPRRDCRDMHGTALYMAHLWRDYAEKLPA